MLEGQTHLEEIIATGIRLQAGVVTPELLETIFFSNTPMHDGAVVLRGDKLAAASCILPVQTESTGERHLGMRHRAALGLTSKVPDASDPGGFGGNRALFGGFRRQAVLQPGAGRAGTLAGPVRGATGGEQPACAGAGCAAAICGRR